MKKIPLKFHNTLTRKKEVFKPINKKEAGIYTCGPTVYWYQHIGNLKAYIFSDILARTLRYNNYKVKHVINITDVGHLTSDADTGEDKMEKAAKKEGKTAKEIADFYTKIFKEDLKKLNILNPTIWSKATEHINEQINLIKILEKKGYTYKTSDGIYFDTSKFKTYGRLTNIQSKGIIAGKRVSMGEKKNPSDFALWKFSQEKRQQEWNSPWGLGFPGWHIECSAMSMKYLGKHFDIHTGGEDHAPIHHNNEIAQSETATGKKFVNYWLHESFLLFKGEKVSKSKGGLYTLSELESLGFKPEHYRYLILLSHYRKQMNFSLEILDSAKTAFERIKRKIIEIRQQKHKAQDKSNIYNNDFQKAINNDLNSTNAIQVFLKALDDVNFDPIKKISLLKKFDEVLGFNIKNFKNEDIKIPKEIQVLINAREIARKEKNFAEADALRQQIKEKGFSVEDTEMGPKIVRV